MYENNMKPTKTVKKGEKGRGLRNSNINGVNLIKVHYMHVVNIIIKHLCIINISNKKENLRK
jgi:hypothetical protein